MPIPNEIRLTGDKTKIAAFQENVQKRIQFKVISALQNWRKLYWENDFAENELLRNELLSFVNEMETKLQEGAWNLTFSQMIKNDFKKYVTTGAPRRRRISNIYSKLENVTIPKNLDITNLRKIKYHELADQLTLMDFRIFKRIEAREYIGQAWKKRDSVKRAPNILTLIKQFNSIFAMIQMHILNEKGLGKRVKRLTYIIRMGERLRETHNYNSWCALFSALNSAPIHRLKQLWKSLNSKEKKLYEEWRRVFDSAENHRKLRASLRTGMQSGTGCVPHIGIYLQDLVFIEDGPYQPGKDKKKNIIARKGNKLVNFAKQMKIADRINYYQQCQQNAHAYSNLKENSVFQRCLLDEFDKYKSLTEDEIWEISTAVRDADKK